VARCEVPGNESIEELCAGLHGFERATTRNDELVANGVVTQRFDPQNTKAQAGSFESRVSTRFTPEASSWLAWRCFEKRPGNRFRFAHTAPWHFDIPGKPLHPRRAEAEWLVANVKREIARSRASRRRL